jgi:hypothetical protein
MLVTTKGRRPKTKTPAGPLAEISLTDDRLVGTTEAARLLGVAPKSLREWRCQRTGPPALKMGAGRQARVFYKLSSLEAWIRSSVTSVIGGQS